MTDVARLYRAFVPNHYELNFHLDAPNLQLTGKTIIYGRRTETSSVLKLHAKDLQCTSVCVDEQACNFTVKNDELCITVPSDCTDVITVTIEYAAAITTAMHGVYPAYPANGGVILGTQFESHHAREAFPCIDEPEAKATYDITITGSAPTILSNMPAKQSMCNDDGSTTVQFERTPLMSSYLVAFVAGDLQRVSTETQDGTAINVWSSKDHNIESLVFALEVAVKTTEFFNDYFGTSYPLPKCDHVALPDFSSGAMENWGLITYREIALLADPNTISTSTKEMVATVIAHEISHQWFGNLVTMRWWDDLWLNESFANFMEYFAIDAIYPEWDVMLTFAAHEALQAFRRDVLPGVQSVATTVHHPDEISSLFDPSIVYAKGGRLLYMVYHIVGDRNFKKGLRQYFKKHAYSNTTGDDLWHALSKASGIDVASIMHTWITQSGFPYIKISPHTNSTVAVEQHQLSTIPSPSDKLWPIPLWHDGQSGLTLMESKEAIVTIESPNSRFNIFGGHYVPYYTDQSVRNHIFKEVAAKSIAPEGRLLVLHDTVLLAKCGVSSLADTLDGLAYYSNETTESVWSVIALVISDTRMIIEGNEAAESALRAFTYTLVEKQFLRLGLEDLPTDTGNDKKLRSIIVGLAVYSEQPEVLAAAINIWNNNTQLDNLNADIRASIMTAAIKHGDDSAFLRLFHEYPLTTNSDIQLDITGALCATKNTNHHEQLLDNLKNTSFVRLQDLDRFLIYLLRNQKSRSAAWDWMTANWQWITETFAQDKSYDSYPRYAGAVLSTTQWLDKYHGHFDPLVSIPSLARNIDLGTKDIESKIAWRTRDEALVSHWLIAQQQS